MTLAGRLAATPGGDGRQLRGKARGAGAEPAVMCPAAQAAIRRARAAPVPGGPSACGSLTPAGPAAPSPPAAGPATAAENRLSSLSHSLSHNADPYCGPTECQVLGMQHR